MALSTFEILILPHVWTQLYIVQNSDPYKTDLLADKQKKKGGGVKDGDCDTYFPDLKKMCGKIIIMG